MPLYQRGDVRIRYEETGSGFPLLVTPGGGLNSRVSNWPTAVFNAMEVFKNDFRCITMDQRNANGGESTGPVPVDNPWDAFADDQLGLMDHLRQCYRILAQECWPILAHLPSLNLRLPRSDWGAFCGLESQSGIVRAAPSGA
jgi:hypothetical protein